MRRDNKTIFVQQEDRVGSKIYNSMQTIYKDENEK